MNKKIKKFKFNIFLCHWCLLVYTTNAKITDHFWSCVISRIERKQIFILICSEQYEVISKLAEYFIWGPIFISLFFSRSLLIAILEKKIIKLDTIHYIGKEFLLCYVVTFVLFRILGALLSAHLIITDPRQPFGNMAPHGYENELLTLANDLGVRLLPAFDNTATGIPYPRVCKIYSETEYLRLFRFCLYWDVTGFSYFFWIVFTKKFLLKLTL